MQLNPVGTVLPEVIVLFPGSIKKIPNFNMFLAIGNAVNRVAKTAEAMGKATTAVSNLA